MESNSILNALLIDSFNFYNSLMKHEISISPLYRGRQGHKESLVTAQNHSIENQSEYLSSDFI